MSRTDRQVLLGDVGVQVGGVDLLAPTSLTVQAGQAVAVMGPSGSGKTTLLNCVSGVTRATSGRVVVDGVEVSALDAAARARFRRRCVGQVFQGPELLDELTVVENVALGLVFAGVARGEAQERAVVELARVGMEAFAAARPDTLSGGQAQRVSLARALVKAGAVLVADEPTAALDAHNAQRVTQVLVQTARDQRVPLLVATHDSSVADLCDAVHQLR